MTAEIITGLWICGVVASLITLLIHDEEIRSGALVVITAILLALGWPIVLMFAAAVRWMPHVGRFKSDQLRVVGGLSARVWQPKLWIGRGRLGVVVIRSAPLTPDPSTLAPSIKEKS